MVPLDALRHYNAVSELHRELSEWAHTARPHEFIVRRLLADGNDIVVDVVKQHRTPEIDRFVVSCLGTAITATAGTLGRVRQTKSFTHHRDLRAWMRATLQLVDGVQSGAARGPACF